LRATGSCESSGRRSNRRRRRVAPLALAPTGSNNDALGWLASGYYLIDYGGTVEQSLWRVERDPEWTTLMLAPWHAYTFPCAADGCAKLADALPRAASWSPSVDVRTLSYGTSSITYAVDLKRPELMVENELAVDGWHSSSPKARPLNTALPFRAWRLAPGSYTFTAHYSDPTRTSQELIALIALLAWLACCVAVTRWRALRRAPRRSVQT
jgi:hypothetical protein